jgi:hypothetical protein
MEIEQSILANKLKLKPPRSRTQTFNTTNNSAELTKRHGSASVNNNDYINTIEELKPTTFIINSPEIINSYNYSPKINHNSKDCA